MQVRRDVSRNNKTYKVKDVFNLIHEDYTVYKCNKGKTIYHPEKGRWIRIRLNKEISGNKIIE